MIKKRMIYGVVGLFAITSLVFGGIVVSNKYTSPKFSEPEFVDAFIKQQNFSECEMMDNFVCEKHRSTESNCGRFIVGATGRHRKFKSLKCSFQEGENSGFLPFINNIERINCIYTIEGYHADGTYAGDLGFPFTFEIENGLACNMRNLSYYPDID